MFNNDIDGDKGVNNFNQKTINLFPVSIHQIDINGFDDVKNDLIDYIYDLKSNEPNGVTLSNRGGWQSSLFELNKDNLLQKFLIKSLNNLPIHQLCSFDGDYWININPPNSFNVKHNHPSTDLAGVLWIKCPDDSGNILFENPFVFHDFTTINAYTDKFKYMNKQYHSFDFQPVEGRILIFPAHLLHEVKENKSNQDRISVSFNLKLSENKEYKKLIETAENYLKKGVMV